MPESGSGSFQSSGGSIASTPSVLREQVQKVGEAHSGFGGGNAIEDATVWSARARFVASKSGVPYERLTREIFQEILDQDSVRTIDVRHNVTLQGKTTAHQIDVYWEFEMGGVRYTTVVQAKDWATPVTQGELLKFGAVLDDLPGQPRGIVITRKGFQHGAEEYARAHGILLYELTENPAPERNAPPVAITTEDYVSVSAVALAYPENPNTIAGIRMDFTISTPKYSNSQMHVDKASRDAMEAKHGFDAVRKALATPITGSPRNTIFYDEGGTPRSTFYDVFATRIHEMANQGELHREVTIPFDVPTFIALSSPTIPFAKVASTSATIDIELRFKQGLGLPNFVEFVLKSLNDGTVRRFKRPRTEVPTQ